MEIVEGHLKDDHEAHGQPGCNATPPELEKAGPFPVAVAIPALGSDLCHDVCSHFSVVSFIQD